MIRIFSVLSVLSVLITGASAQVLSDKTTQCIVGIADDWGSSEATVSLYEKNKGEWKQVGNSWSSRLGRKGLAWGLGLHPIPAGSTLKKEGDLKSPAGVFELGGVWGYDRSIKKRYSLPYTRITSRHLWVEDPESKYYNRQVVLDREPDTEWEKKAQMRQNDPAHSLKLFIAHNAPPNVMKGAGSSIFFHIWREDGGRATAGCTTMAESKLRELIAQIDPEKRPVYVLLPKKEYAKYKKAWKLP